MTEAIPKTVVVDFDGVIAQYDGWHDGKWGAPMQGVHEALEELREMGFVVIIQTARLHPRWGSESFQEKFTDLVDYLRIHRIPYDAIDPWAKAPAHYYIDDRGVRFNNWEQALAAIKTFERWAAK